jgi:hypothetical protein
MGELVDLVIDPLRGERLSLELPLVVRTAPEVARAELGLPEWVDVSDPIVARGVALLRATRTASPPVSVALLGGAANRLRCRSSNTPDFGLRRSLHDLDIACLHKELRAVRSLLETLHEREGSGLRFFETNGDRIFNSLSEGRRLRLHMVLGQQGAEISLGTVDILADEFRFCHRLDLRDDVAGAARQHGTLSLAVLLLAKLQYIQRIPGEDRAKVPDRVLAPFGRHDVVIGPEAKDVSDILALVRDHPLEDAPEGISPSRISGIVGTDWGLWRTATLNVEMVLRSPLLESLPEPARGDVRDRLQAIRALLSRLSPKRRFGFAGSEWWEEVDAQPAVDGTVRVG